MTGRSWVIFITACCIVSVKCQADDGSQIQLGCLAYQSSLVTNLSASLQRSLPANVPSPWPVDQLAEQLAALLSACTNRTSVAVRAIKLLFAAQVAPVIKPALKSVESLSGFKVAVSYQPFIDILEEIMVQLNNKLNITDIWNYDSPGIVNMAESAGGFGFVDLKPFIDSDDGLLQWQDLHPFFKQVSSIYKGKVIGLPVTAFQPYLFYRRDIFAKYNLSVPVSWDEYLAVAKRLNGTDLDGDGLPNWPICMSSGIISIKLSFMATYSPSFIQTGGYSQGYLFDPTTMQPLLNNPAMAAAMQLLLNIMDYVGPGPKGEPKYESPTSLASFAKCAMGIYSAELFKASWQWPTLKGKIGTAMVPGSTRVLDRTTMQLVPCRPDLCSDMVVDAQGNTISVNRALSAGISSISLGMNPHTAAELRPAVWKVMSAFASPSVLGQAYVMSPLTPFGPIRSSQLALSSENLAQWARAGYSMEDTTSFLAVTEAVLSHKNRVLDLAIPDALAGFIVPYLDEIYNLLKGDQTIQTTMQNIESKFQAKVASLGSPERFATQYREMLKFVLPEKQVSKDPTLDRTSSQTSVLIPAIVVPVVVLGLVAVLAAVLVRQVRKAHEEHRTLLGGAVIPPKPGPRTTLLVTDVEGSTALFEAIPQAMDMALGIHNSIMTTVLDKHSGYASASEGDGWVVAFHTPDAALSAAVALQEAFLQAEWPAELLQQSCCCPVSVSLSNTGPIPATAWANVLKNLAKDAVFSIHHILTVSCAAAEFDTRSTLPPVQSLAGSMQSLHLMFTKSLGADKQQDIDMHDELETSATYPELTAEDDHAEAQADGLIKVAHKLGAAPPGATLAQGPFFSCSLQHLWKAAFVEQASNMSTSEAGAIDAAVERAASHASMRPSVLAQASRMDSINSLAVWSPDAPQARAPNRLRLDRDVRDPSFSQPSPPFTQMEHSGPLSFLSTAKALMPWGLRSRSHLAGLSAPGKSAFHNSTLVYKGLRVRMGIHSGLEQVDDVVVNKTTGRHQYGGAFLAAAKSVGDAAYGGMVLASQETFQQASWSSLSSQMAVLSVGEHVLKTSADLQSTTRVLYEVVPHPLALRVTIRPPQLRSVRCKQPGYHVAPCGTVAVGYFQAVGIPALMSWDPEATHQSLKLMHGVATSLLAPFGGYLLDLSEALGILAAFSSSSDAIRWALIAQRVLMHADWPPELLEHPLGEELSLMTTVRAPGMGDYPGGQVRLSTPPRTSPLSAKQVFQPADSGSTPSAFTMAAGRHVKFAMDETHEDAGDRRSMSSYIATDLTQARLLLLRGLRTKCGIDVGEVRTTLNELSGRITYVGKVMNRAARITQATKSGQVWCSSSAWDATAFMCNTPGMMGKPSHSGMSSFTSRITNQGSASLPIEPKPSIEPQVAEAQPAALDVPADATANSATSAPVIMEGARRGSVHPAAPVLEAAVTQHEPLGTFGTKTEDLPVSPRLRQRQRSSSSVGSCATDDDAAAMATEAAAELCNLKIGAISLGPQKLKSLKEILVLVRCELERTALAAYEAASCSSDGMRL